MDPNQRAARIQRMLTCTNDLFRTLHTGSDQALLAVDLTMPQLKALVCVVQESSATSGQIARRLGVGLSSLTGVVDRLADQGLVTRREDPDDRRITRVMPTPRGKAMVDQLLRYREEQVVALLSRLNETQLQVIDEAFSYLLAAAREVAQARQEQDDAA